MVGRQMAWKVRVQNTFMNIPEELDDSDYGIHKSLSMNITQDNLNKWYIYNLPSFENRNDWNLLHNQSDKTGVKYFLKPTSMFNYYRDDDSKNINSNGCVPIDENGNLTSIGSVSHLLNDCKPCAFYKHRTKKCVNGIRCQFCHFEHDERRKPRGRNFRNHRLL
ncbi:hypothetical protein TpMuguga_01g01016 [Theileria parva strain Muguga]|uniref:uncharacterized protein n=1 Tax=Theileria parva strain Muguga TaxID=333668 RepID=UPI001C620B2C|nr:uncharacterized protein TpMuguga_01g01016 [Theileria parva strain Muguga]EAN34254.2 hypothetical protein TpMuguga_01g01016 [Theileria parva strain Muguga]